MPNKLAWSMMHDAMYELQRLAGPGPLTQHDTSEKNIEWLSTLWKHLKDGTKNERGYQSDLTEEYRELLSKGDHYLKVIHMLYGPQVKEQ